VQLCKVFELIRRTRRGRCILDRLIGVLRTFLILPAGAVMRHGSACRRAYQQSTSPGPSSHSHNRKIHASATWLHQEDRGNTVSHVRRGPPDRLAVEGQGYEQAGSINSTTARHPTRASERRSSRSATTPTITRIQSLTWRRCGSSDAGRRLSRAHAAKGQAAAPGARVLQVHGDSGERHPNTPVSRLMTRKMCHPSSALALRVANTPCSGLVLLSRANAYI
jgi:hypothetical protein